MSGIGIMLEQVKLELGGRTVLGPLDLSLPAGSHTLLLGANGAGKTQLLKLIGGERWPTPTSRQRRVYRRRGGTELELSELLPRIVHLGGERQDKYLRYEWNFSVQRMIGTGCHGGDRPLVTLTASQRRRVRHLMIRLALWPLRRRRFLTLSYGERRRVLLARALAAQPHLLLLDEPFNGLDAPSRALLIRELARLATTRLTMVLAAHRLEDAPRGFRRALVLRRGRIVYDGGRGPRAQAWLQTSPGRKTARARPAAAARAVARPAGGVLVRLRAVDLYRDYRPVIRGLNWTIGPGESWGIVGANGSGKTTLLRFLYGDLPAALGGLVERRAHPPGSHVELWRRRVGWVSPELQAEYLERVSVAEFIVSGLHASIGLDQPPTRSELRRAAAALERVRLDVPPARAATELSYGQRRLALIARALVAAPEALLLDEPLTGLDAEVRARVRILLSTLAASGVQLVMATHHASDLVPEIGHVMTLAHGRARATRR